MAKNMYPVLRDRPATSCCPACGQKVPDADLRVDLQTNLISAGGLIIQVQPRTAELVELLRRSFPHYVPRETIISRVWANNAIDRMVDAQATRARVLLRKIGWGIESYRHSGYRLAQLVVEAERATLVPALASFARLQYSRRAF